MRIEEGRWLLVDLPEANESIPLVVFSAVPASCIRPDVRAEMLWEELAQKFQKAFNYGKGPEATEITIQTPHGLDVGAVELKVEHRLESLKSVAVLDYDADFDANRLTAIESVASLKYSPVRGPTSPGSSVDEETEVPPPTTPSLAASTDTLCSGLLLPSGFDFPFGCHQLFSVPSKGLLRSAGCRNRSRRAPEQLFVC
jgi:hypothetical protein